MPTSAAFSGFVKKAGMSWILSLRTMALQEEKVMVILPSVK